MLPLWHKHILDDCLPPLWHWVGERALLFQLDNGFKSEDHKDMTYECVM